MGGFYKHFGLRVTPRRSIFFVSMPTLGPHYSATNQSNSKIKVPTNPSSHVLSAQKNSNDLVMMKFLTSDPWPTPKWAIYIGGGTSRWPIWPKFWLRGFLDQTSWLTKKNWPKCHFSGFSPLIYNWIGASLLVMNEWMWYEIRSDRIDWLQNRQFRALLTFAWPTDRPTIYPTNKW